MGRGFQGLHSVWQSLSLGADFVLVSEVRLLRVKSLECVYVACAQLVENRTLKSLERFKVVLLQEGRDWHQTTLKPHVSTVV